MWPCADGVWLTGEVRFGRGRQNCCRVICFEQPARHADSHGCRIVTQPARRFPRLGRAARTNKEITGKLQISPATVKNHVHTILEKLNVGRHLAARSAHRQVQIVSW